MSWKSVILTHFPCDIFGQAVSRPNRMRIIEICYLPDIQMQQFHMHGTFAKYA